MNLDGASGIDVLLADQALGTVNVLLGGFANLGSSVAYRSSALPTDVQANLTGTATSPLVFDGAASVATGDFNEDHVLDVIVAHRGSNTLGLLLGNGSG